MVGILHLKGSLIGYELRIMKWRLLVWISNFFVWTYIYKEKKKKEQKEEIVGICKENPNNMRYPTQSLVLRL